MSGPGAAWRAHGLSTMTVPIDGKTPPSKGQRVTASDRRKPAQKKTMRALVLARQQ